MQTRRRPLAENPPIHNRMKYTINEKMEETDITLENMPLESIPVNKLSTTNIRKTPMRVPVSHNVQKAEQDTKPIKKVQPSQNQIDYDFNEILKEENIMMVNENPYLKISQLGEGGSSVVYKVITPDKNIYALKQVDTEGSNPAVVDGFKNEIALLQKLQKSDRIIKLVDSEINEDTISIVLELGDIDLKQLIEKNRIDDERIDPNFLRLIWQQMLEAVQTVHNELVVHGDLKPANFLFVSGTIKLIDFGIALAIDKEAETTSVERLAQAGTINYMAPECLERRPTRGNQRKIKQGRPSDVWSLGCILYQLVYNQPVFPQSEIITKIQAITNPNYEIEYPFIEEMPDFNYLEDVMRLCLQRNPKDRPTISQLLSHPYLTFNRQSITRNIQNLIIDVRDNFQDFDLDSEFSNMMLEEVVNSFYRGEEVDLQNIKEQLEQYH